MALGLQLPSRYEAQGLRRLSRSRLLRPRSLEPPPASRRLAVAPCTEEGRGGSAGGGAGGPWDPGAIWDAAAEPRREERGLWGKDVLEKPFLKTPLRQENVFIEHCLIQVY